VADWVLQCLPAADDLEWAAEVAAGGAAVVAAEVAVVILCWSSATGDHWPVVERRQRAKIPGYQVADPAAPMEHAR